MVSIFNIDSSKKKQFNEVLYQKTTMYYFEF